MKILIADDDRTIHISFAKPLANSGFDILHSYDGLDALRQAQESKPDVILLDLTMPKLDGREICKQLKSSSETKDIIIIMLTAKDQHHDRLLGFELGADEYISKPCSIAFLERIIRKLTRKKGAVENP
jgi:DNA-binding response OmpR family regulator